MAITSPLMALHNVICRARAFPPGPLCFSRVLPPLRFHSLSFSLSLARARLSRLIFKHQSRHFPAKRGAKRVLRLIVLCSRYICCTCGVNRRAMGGKREEGRGLKRWNVKNAEYSSIWSILCRIFSVIGLDFRRYFYFSIIGNLMVEHANCISHVKEHRRGILNIT